MEFHPDADWRDAVQVHELVAPLVEFNSLCPTSGHPLPAGRGEGRDEGRDKNWAELLELPAVRTLAGSLRQLREPDPAENLSPVLAEALYGPTLQSSVSRLEEFAQCPFRFFVHSGLRAEERKVFELDARERGSFQHEVLKQFHEQLTAEGRRWRDLTPAAARNRVGQIASELAPGYRDGLLRADDQGRFTARMLGGWLQDFVEMLVTWMHGQYEFDPAVAHRPGTWPSATAINWPCAGELTGLICSGRPPTVPGAWWWITSPVIESLIGFCSSRVCSCNCRPIWRRRDIGPVCVRCPG
jgi:ATP-dependent helicase/nuclease subunit B